MNKVVKKDDSNFKELLSFALQCKRRQLERWTREMITREISRTRAACVEMRFEKDKGVSFIDKDGNIIRNFGKPES